MVLPSSGKSLARRIAFCIILTFLLSAWLEALDLHQARVEKLENGLTVMILEDHTLPLVSTQVLYRVGGRNECQGSTGLAHFVEHMAFRATAHFPGTDVVSRIYAVGGEWHGYTWIDQTTYFETVPVKYLDLVLQIQADRMASIVNNPDEIEAERGSVLTELHSYENDPASLLYDEVLAASFQQHPYRYNVIGWASDVEQITHDDIENFYHRYYKPSNAVLAVAGDVRADDVLQQIRGSFGAIPAGDPPAPPRAVEPPQKGERRVTVRGSGSTDYFQITYHAPAAKQPDYAAFLVLQALLTGSGGVNFQQRGEGEPAREGSRLYGIAPGIATFFQPTADPYAIDITGHVPASESESRVEGAVEAQVQKLREQAPSAEELAAAQKQILAELSFDVETTEDAAHQMAFFEGIGAFDVLLNLPRLVQAVTPADVQRAAVRYLQPDQRTIGWYVADGSASAELAASQGGRAMAKHTPSVEAGPRIRKLRNGVVCIAGRVARTPTGYLQAVVSTNTVEIGSDSDPDEPYYGFTSVGGRFLKEDFAKTVTETASRWSRPASPREEDPAGNEDPEARLEKEMRDVLGLRPVAGAAAPVAVAVSGDVSEDEALKTLEEAFGKLPKAKAEERRDRLQVKEAERTVRLPGKPQSQFGYAVPAAAPGSRDVYAWRILLYILSHGYEGRLGKDLISRKGLIYYIDSNYRSDSRNGWITMTVGVNPDKLEVTRARFREILQDLKANPPTEAEVAEAKTNLIGRRITGYQSNRELTGRYLQEWLVFGRLLSQQEFEQMVNAITLEQVQALVPSFLSGAMVTIDTR